MASSTNTSATALHCKRVHHQRRSTPSTVRASPIDTDRGAGRRGILRTLISTAVAFTELRWNAAAVAENWGTHSLLKERFFMPDLSPEDSVGRIKQTAEGLHRMRDMLENMSWRYVLFYVRQKHAYLSKDLKIAADMVPLSVRAEYTMVANEFIDNFAQLDFYVRTPKVYESMLYYEKSMKNLDDIVAMFV